jgi:DNA-binding transcriptional LysR family regulator
MNLQQLRYFLATARHGSFSAAAEALHLAQPSLSQQVRALEGELGVPLFVRAGRGIVLTEAGRRLQPEAEAVLAAVERARDAVAEVREIRSGTLTFGTFGIAGAYGLADVIEELRRRYPGVRVRAVGQNSSEVADAVRAGELEVGMVVLPVDDAGLDVRPAVRDEVLYVSADPERVRRRMSVRRLAEAPLILYDARWGDEDPTRRQLAERAQRAGVRLEPVIEVEDMDVALDLAARGLGDTVVEASIVGTSWFPDGLHTVPFTEPLREDFAFISRRGAALSPAAREAVAVVEQRLLSGREAL